MCITKNAFPWIQFFAVFMTNICMKTCSLPAFDPATTWFRTSSKLTSLKINHFFNLNSPIIPPAWPGNLTIMHPSATFLPLLSKGTFTKIWRQKSIILFKINKFLDPFPLPRHFCDPLQWRCRRWTSGHSVYHKVYDINCLFIIRYKF